METIPCFTEDYVTLALNQAGLNRPQFSSLRVPRCLRLITSLPPLFSRPYNINLNPFSSLPRSSLDLIPSLFHPVFPSFPFLLYSHPPPPQFSPLLTLLLSPHPISLLPYFAFILSHRFPLGFPVFLSTYPIIFLSFPFFPLLRFLPALLSRLPLPSLIIPLLTPIFPSLSLYSSPSFYPLSHFPLSLPVPFPLHSPELR